MSISLLFLSFVLLFSKDFAGVTVRLCVATRVWQVGSLITISRSLVCDLFVPRFDSMKVYGDVSGVLYAVEFASLVDFSDSVLKINYSLLGLNFVVLQAWL